MSLTRLRWPMLAIFAASGSFIVVSYGLFGWGSSGTTAAILVLPVAALVALGDWRGLTADSCDMIFVAFVGYIGLSLATHPMPDVKDLALLSIALLCYPAGRLFRADSIDPMFENVLLLIACAAAFFTLIALVQGSLDFNGKPKVFGAFAAAPAQFAVSFVIAVGAVASRNTAPRWLSLVLVTILGAIFAAAMVRFTLVAAVVALIGTALLTSRAPRRAFLTLAGILIVGAAIGQLSRPETTAKFRKYEAQAIGFSRPTEVAPAQSTDLSATANTPHTTIPKDFIHPTTPENRCSQLDDGNSVAVRKMLYKEWLRLLPEAGLTGIGLNGFMDRACITRSEVHNTILQAALEFGWPAALLLTLVIGIGWVRCFRARGNEGARLGLFALSFLVLMSMAHGDISREFLMFFFIGYAVQAGPPLREARQAIGQA